MIFSHVDGYTAYFKVKMIRCRNCGEHMVDNHFGSLPGTTFSGLRSEKVKVCSNDFGVCDACLDAGNYPVKCDLCGHYKKYPSEFKYKATEYVRDCDPFYVMICADCVANKPQEVIRLLADADDIEKVQSS